MSTKKMPVDTNLLDTNDYRIITNPDNWPMWPCLPVVHRESGALGIVCDIEGLQDTVVEVTEFVAVDFKALSDPNTKMWMYAGITELLEQWRVKR